MRDMIVKLGVINHVAELSHLSKNVISEGAGVIVMENSDENDEKLVFP